MGRFINADSYSSTGQGILGTNMFAYCNNNPASGTDPSGSRMDLFIISESAAGNGSYQKNEDEAEAYRDVTKEIDDALAPYISMGKEYHLLGLIYPQKNVEKYLVFYCLVNHKCMWDIKIETVWKNTIGTEFPGKNQAVLYHGNLFTPEDLGNYTYGVLGNAFGIPLPVLHAGSYYAADFPTSSSELENELKDWRFISRGFYGIG